MDLVIEDEFDELPDLEGSEQALERLMASKDWNVFD